MSAQAGCRSGGIYLHHILRPDRGISRYFPDRRMRLPQTERILFFLKRNFCYFFLFPSLFQFWFSMITIRTFPLSYQIILSDIDYSYMPDDLFYHIYAVKSLLIYRYRIWKRSPSNDGDLFQIILCILFIVFVWKKHVSYWKAGNTPSMFFPKWSDWRASKTSVINTKSILE